MVECTALEMRRAREGTEGSNPSLSANTLSSPIHRESRKVSFRAALSAIRVRSHPLPSIGDRLAMWEKMWEILSDGKALCDLGKGGHAARTTW